MAFAQLLLSDNDFITQATNGINESRQLDARFGSSLAAYDDTLIIGAPNASVGGVKAGAIYITRYYRSGFPFSSDKFSQADSSVTGSAETGDNFGYRGIVMNGFAGDSPEYCYPYDYFCRGYVDVIVGAPFENIGSTQDSGYANIIDSGNDDCGSGCSPLAVLYQGNGIAGTPEDNDLFGFSMAVGDFNGDMINDLAIGAPGEAVNANLATAAGSVSIIMGEEGVGLTQNNDSTFSQSSLDGAARDDENFAYALAVGDFDGDGEDDLAVGVPKDEQTDGANRTGGGINIIYGNINGLSLFRNKAFNQDTAGVVGISESGDRFGHALAIGVPLEDIGSISNAGSVVIMYGVLTNNGSAVPGISSTGNHSIHQNTDGVAGSAESGDEFGSSLAVGDFNRDGKDDLAIGTSGNLVSTGSNNGSVSVVYQLSEPFVDLIFTNGFE